jgi:hypothetical protein
MEALVQRLGKTESNDEFLENVGALIPSGNDAPERISTASSRRRS